MMISNKQAERVLDEVRSGSLADPDDAQEVHEISSELEERIRSVIDLVPEIRTDKVAAAREHLVEGSISSHAVAVKMIHRVLSDSIR